MRAEIKPLKRVTGEPGEPPESDAAGGGQQLTRRDDVGPVDASAVAHTLDAVETINRVISIFPPPEQKQIRMQLAAVLRAIKHVADCAHRLQIPVNVCGEMASNPAQCIVLLGLGLVEEVRLDVCGLIEFCYRMTPAGLRAYQAYVAAKGDELPPVKDAALCTNGRSLSDQKDGLSEGGEGGGARP